MATHEQIQILASHVTDANYARSTFGREDLVLVLFAKMDEGLKICNRKNFFETAALPRGRIF